MRNIKKILAFTTFLVIFVMFTGVVSATTYTVNPGTTIQSVINKAASNDTITVNDKNGTAYTYKENIVINKTIKLQAKSGGLVTIQASNASYFAIDVLSGGSGSIIKGFTIKGATGNSTAGILIDHASKCNVSQNTITDNYIGVRLQYSNSITLYNNKVNGNTGDGIDLLYSNSTTLSLNNVTGNNFNGIELGYTKNNIITANNATDNTIGIYVWSSSNTSISGNNVACNDFGNDWGIYS